MSPRSLRDAAPPRLSEAVLRKLQGQYWGRKPALFRDETPILSTEFFFSVFREMSEAMRSASYEPPWRAPIVMYIEEPSKEEGVEGSLVLSPLRHLPHSGDASVRSYVNRVDARFGSRRFGVQIRNMERNWQVWAQFSPLAQELQSLFKTPDGGIDIVGFLGNYTRTPFGIHKDSQDIITFVLSGHKRMLLWPLEAFERRPEVPKDPALKQSAIYPLEKNEFLRTERKAIRFDARRGDVMYWSPSYWHCAAASPGLAVTLTMGFEQDAEGRRRFREAASSKSTREAGPQKSEVEIRLELATRCGLASSPDRASLRDLAEGESLQLTGPWPIRSSKLNARVLAVAAHGYSLRVPASFAPMIRALNTRATFRVGALLDLVEPRTGSGRNKARSALADFSSWHALHVGSARATARNTKGLTTRSQRR